MKYGFVIDNRKCIGCHACTTACKSEHQVPVGVNRTWVKYTEKGNFPNTRRIFSVMRCNHCTDAPCVEICPVEALYFREDGIVDFDNDRCIGCKSCMQACPYDALYIDPETHTAAKCNYCAHRVDIGLEPACVNVCPEHAIISGDMENPTSEIAQLLAMEQVTVRKAAKGTNPNLFYIDGDEASLNPIATEKSDNYLWSAQERGVGHFAKAAEKLAFSNDDVLQTLLENNGQSAKAEEAQNGMKSIDVVMGKARRTYDVPDKGILWGWEVSAYVLTKAISAGAFLLIFLAGILGKMNAVSSETMWWGLGISLVFLAATGLLLIKDLDRPDRFLYVLLRPQWNSWLVKGGYSITIFGGLLTLWGASMWFGWAGLENIIMWGTAIFAAITAVYTAFLFAQAKGRDFWQSPTLAIHMLVHSFMAGAAVFMLIGTFVENSMDWMNLLRIVLISGIVVNLFTIAIELITTHPTEEAKRTVDMIVSGRYKNSFWGGVIVFGNVIPLALLYFGGMNGMLMAVAGLIVLIGIYLTEKIWVEAPQRIPLS
ncbi:MAG: polysulfide reductase NrfD [Bacteroidetes bacterium]|jgi:Fe-S-cluster-containing dehydrogenase component/formate-dependent nitrite reductase membrane component NrfD|nr:polysulfide reductase NrfD [Bacteroidota bacterium]